MDTTDFLRKVYACYREKRLAEATELLSDDFQFKTYLSDDPFDPTRPRSRAELTILAHKFFEEYDILILEPGPIAVNNGTASTKIKGSFRHKQTGKIMETAFQHDWRFSDGKACELSQSHDIDGWIAFVNSLDGHSS